MIFDHKFGSNCDQDLPRRRWLGDTAIFPALVLIGIVVMGTAAIAILGDDRRDCAGDRGHLFRSWCIPWSICATCRSTMSA